MILVLIVLCVLILVVGGLTVAVVYLTRSFGSYGNVRGDVEELKLDVEAIKDHLFTKEKSA